MDDDYITWVGDQDFFTFFNTLELGKVSFVSVGFIAFYLAGKLRIFSSVGRGKSWRLCAFILSLSVALAVAVSRTCDYHHHWQDVLCGSLLGISISYLCYRQYYPSLTSIHSHIPYAAIKPHLELEAVCSSQSSIQNEEQIK